MSARSLLLVAAALLLTVGTVLVARSWLNSQKQAPSVQDVREAPKTEVMVARTDLPAGSFVTEQNLRWQTWPDDNLPETYLVKGQAQESSFYGAVMRRTVPAGQPLISSQMVKPGERSFLAAVLKPGYRAYSIKVNETSSIAGLVFPGDRVDLLLTHKVEANGSAVQVTETVLTNMRILAIDQKLNSVDSQPRVGKTVTFEVTPKQAEILAVADDLGRLSLSLRSLASNEAELKRIQNTGVYPDDVDATMGRTATRDFEASILKGAAGNSVQVQRGSTKREEKVKQ